MSKRNYELKDIYDYLLEQYNIEWLGYKIIDNNVERCVEEQDFVTLDDEQGSKLSVVAVVYNGSKLQKAKLEVSNYSLRIVVDQKPKISWQLFLNQRYSEEKII